MPAQSYVSNLPPGSAGLHLAIIAALARNGVIGIDNRLPWRLPGDLKRFKTLTMGHPIIMGRKTWESIGKPLPGRRNLVVSRNPDYLAAGAEVFGSLKAALRACAGCEGEIFVVGGAELYALALPIADRMYLTEVLSEVDGDAYFPDFDRSLWLEESRIAGPVDAEPAFQFVNYRRVER